MNVLGISCHYHDAAACLYRDGVLTSAIQEERLNRRKHEPDFPILAINSCLQQAGLTALDLDYVGFYEKPYLKLVRAVISHIRGYPFSGRNFMRSQREWLSKRLTLPLDVDRELSFTGPVLFVPHHLAHAGSAFFASPFEEAAVLTADGLGEWATTSFGVGRGLSIEIEKELHYPDSLGLVYSAVTSWLGFRANSDEGRVMALAACAGPASLDRFRGIVEAKEDGSFRVDESFFEFVRGRRMYSRKFERAFGPPREPGAEIETRHEEIAASLQALVEEILVRIARHIHARTGLPRLCAAGGVFLNCVANSRLLEDTPFREVFVQPAAGDSGGALGVAAVLSHSLLSKPRAGAMTHTRLGPSYSPVRTWRCLVSRGVPFRELPEAEIASSTASLIADGKIVGWFQGRMEFGPRALGGRSILADPRRPDMKDVLNARVKHREPFRPYGVSILLDRTPEFFEFDAPSPFMLMVARARPGTGEKVPAALHVDGTSRLQTVTAEENGLYYDVVFEFDRLTGVPMIINTSFNDHGEPIVCTPEDAVDCFLATEIDALVLGRYLAVKDGVGEGDARHPPPPR